MGLSLRLQFLFVVLTICCGSSFSNAADPYSVPMAVAVENKMFEPSHELNFQLGILPLDAFYKAAILSAAYTRYFASYWGWEVVNGSIAFSKDTGLRDELRQFNVQEDKYLDYIKFAATTNLIYTPVYNKNLMFNKSIVHGEMSGVFGGGMVAFKSGDTAPMVGGGLILRFFMSPQWSAKLDNRLYYHLSAGKSSSFFMAVNLGFAYEFDPGGKKARRLNEKVN